MNKTPDDIKKGLQSLQPDMLIGMEDAETNFKDGVLTLKASKRHTVANVIECIEMLTEKLEKANGMLEWTHKEVLRLNIENSELGAKLSMAERERDACIKDIQQCQGAICNSCKHHYRPNPEIRRYACAILGEFDTFLEDGEGKPFVCGRFEWRGICEENAKEE